MKMKLIFRALLILTVMILPGCSGGGGGASVSTTPTPNPNGSSVTISGVAVKGPISGGDVRVYAVRNGQVDTSAVLGLGKTAADGSYSISLVSVPTGPVVVEVAGGAYTDEASGAPGVALKGKLRACAANAGDGAKIAVTPVTHLACTQVEGIGAYTTVNIDDSNVQIARFFEVSDIIGSLPFDPTQSAPLGATNDQKKYAAVLGVVSQLINNRKGTQGLADATDAVVTQLGTELKRDGGFSLTTINDINVAITDYSKSGKNRGGLIPRPIIFSGGVLQLSTAGALPAGAAINGLDYEIILPQGVTVKVDPATGETLPGVVDPVSLAATNSIVSAKFNKVTSSLRIILINVQPGIGIGEFAHVEFNGFPVAGDNFGVKVNRIDGGSGASSAPLAGVSITYTFAGL